MIVVSRFLLPFSLAVTFPNLIYANKTLPTKSDLTCPTIAQIKNVKLNKTTKKHHGFFVTAPILTSKYNFLGVIKIPNEANSATALKKATSIILHYNLHEPTLTVQSFQQVCTYLGDPFDLKKLSVSAIKDL